jgi:hypothetical protein
VPPCVSKCIGWVQTITQPRLRSQYGALLRHSGRLTAASRQGIPHWTNRPGPAHGADDAGPTARRRARHSPSRDDVPGSAQPPTRRRLPSPSRPRRPRLAPIRSEPPLGGASPDHRRPASADGLGRRLHPYVALPHGEQPVLRSPTAGAPPYPVRGDFAAPGLSNGPLNVRGKLSGDAPRRDGLGGPGRAAQRRPGVWATQEAAGNTAVPSGLQGRSDGLASAADASTDGAGDARGEGHGDRAHSPGRRQRDQRRRSAPCLATGTQDRRRGGSIGHEPYHHERP